jgi:serine/threonine-protein kinase RsbW
MSPRPAWLPQLSRRSRGGFGGPPCLSKSFPAVPESVRLVRGALVDVAESAGATSETVEAVRVASSEAATNVVVHAYDGGPGEIDLTAGLNAPADGMWVVVADGGRGLDFGTQSPGLELGFVWMAWFSEGLALGPSRAGGA